MTNKSVVCIVLVSMLPAVRAAEIQVNIRTSGSQANPAVAMDAAGGSIVVWSSYFTTSGRSNDILARQLDPLGDFVGDEFLVNTMTAGNQTEPAVATDTGGGFAIAWQGPGLDQEDVFVRLFDPNGQSTADELLVNSRTAGRQLYPSVAMSDARLILAWESREVVADVNRIFVHAQVFEPNSEALATEITPDTTAYNGRYPRVAADSAGHFVVAWMQDRSSHPIMARLFDPNGVPATDAFQVNTESIASLTRPAVAMTSLGYFVVAWDGDPNRASDDDVYARLYDPDGQPAGEPLVVNTVRTGAQRWPQVAINDANEFVVIWEHDTSDPNTATDIFARRFDGEGRPIGDPFQINTYAQSRQRYPDVGMAADGSFIATWESQGQDGASYGVFAHITAATTTSDANGVGP
ncbi:MAG: hypothetical protein JW955_08715 [Sedimentisphaerales bacterium]|nr:hypothetical protein [Sedimentisphaerales bacterium]